MQKQHVDLSRKLRLRKALLKHAADGAVYVPFIGDGDIAAKLYGAHKVYGADLDPERVASARSKVLTGDIRQADCDSYPFAEVQTGNTSVADFDAYCNPYLAFLAWWVSAPKAGTVVVFGTDGIRQLIKRNRKVVKLPDAADAADAADYRRQYNFWWTRYVKPWLAKTIEPWKIVKAVKYLRKDMLYWGIVIQDESTVGLMQEAGQLLETVKGDREEIEVALGEAAKSGNVKAMELWLELHPPQQRTYGHKLVVLNRTQLIELQNNADRYPMLPEERREAIELTIWTWRNAGSPRTRLQAVKTFATLDRLNLPTQQRQTDVTVNILGHGQINLTQASDEALLRLEKTLGTGFGEADRPSHANRNGENGAAK